MMQYLKYLDVYDGKAFRVLQIKVVILDCITAAAAKSLQSCPTLCDPIDGSPPGSFIHVIFQARVLEWGAIAFSTALLSIGQML